MFCKNCGAKIGDNAMFCAKCGSRVVSRPQEARTEIIPPVELNKQENRSTGKKGKGLLILLISCIVVALLALTCVFLFFGDTGIGFVDDIKNRLGISTSQPEDDDLEDEESDYSKDEADSDNPEPVQDNTDMAAVSSQDETLDVSAEQDASLSPTTEAATAEPAATEAPAAEAAAPMNPLNDEFGIDPYTQEDYTNNLNKNEFRYFDSGISDFNFRYPLHIYNDVQKTEDAYTTSYGTNVVTYTFTGNKGSRLSYTLIKRNDSRSIKEMTNYVYSTETSMLYDSADIVNSTTSDHGKVIVTGWEDASKDIIIYDMTKIESDYVLQMRVFMTDFTDDYDKNVKSYITECLYRYCGFSDTKYAVRTFEEYLEEN